MGVRCIPSRIRARRTPTGYPVTFFVGCAYNIRIGAFARLTVNLSLFILMKSLGTQVATSGFFFLGLELSSGTCLTAYFACGRLELSRFTHFTNGRTSFIFVSTRWAYFACFVVDMCIVPRGIFESSDRAYFTYNPFSVVLLVTLRAIFARIHFKFVLVLPWYTFGAGRHGLFWPKKPRSAFATSRTARGVLEKPSRAEFAVIFHRLDSQFSCRKFGA